MRFETVRRLTLSGSPGFNVAELQRLSTMFHSALWKLIRLKWRGGFRQLWRSLKTLRGCVQAGFIVLMMAYGIGSMFFVGRMSSASPDAAAMLTDRLRDVAAFGLFAFTTWAMLFSTGEATVYFTSSEVAFLFPAPFHRRQLLTYKLLQSLGGLVFVSFLFSLFLARSVWLWLGGFAGIVLTLSFVQLLTMNVAFVRQVLEAKSNVLLRRVLGSSVSVWVLIAVTQMALNAPSGDLASLAISFRTSTAGRWLLAPFDVFARMIFANDRASFSVSTGCVLLLDTMLLAAAYRLDGLSLEAALAISEKLTARIKLAQTKGAWHMFGSPTSQVAKRRLPRLPFWNGVGPIVWQRVTTNIRTSVKLFALLGGAVLIAGGLTFGVHHKTPEQPFAAAEAGIGVMVYVSFLICMSLQNEIERVGYLKSLPISSVAIVLGELLGFVVLLSVVQGSFFLALCGLLPTLAGWLVCAAVLSLPLNFLLFGIDKLIFYWYPTRMAKGAPGDFQNAGRQMLFVFLKMLLLGGGLALVGVAAIPGAMLRSPLLAVIPAAVVLLAECAGLVPLLTYAFHRFDPSVDTPA